MSNLISRCTIGGLMLAVLATAAWSQDRPTREEPNSGSYLYRAHCASCHGADGRGDGPAVRTLRVAPPDLTTIAQRRGGLYPSGEIAQIIDGRKPLPSHMRQEMPRWGVVLRRMEGENEHAVEEHVAALVAHLEAWQRNRWR